MSHKFLLFFLVVLYIAYSKYDLSNIKCRHNEVVQENKARGERRTVSHVNYENHPWEVRESNTRRSISTHKPIRLHLDTSQLDADGDMSSSKRTYLKTYVLPKAKLRIEGLLKVIPVLGNLAITTINCNNIINPTPAAHRSTGVSNSDVIIYVSGQSPQCSSSTLAFASSCDWDVHDRPIAGFINFCPSKVDSTEISNLEVDKIVSIAVHEILHALGFSGNEFENYRHPNGDVRGLSNVIQSFSERGHTVSKFVTETALTVARNHFECPTLNGVEIEDGGGSGTSGSHTEQRIYKGDIMNGQHYEFSVYSDLTVAILQDSGWYIGNFTNTERLWWGLSDGCDFAMEKCLQGPKSSPEITGKKNQFCTQNAEKKCTADRMSIGYCYMGQYGSPLPSYFQYFGDTNLGGQELNDYCPIYIPFDISGSTRSSSCIEQSNSDNLINQYYGEIYGSTSRCFDSSLRNQAISKNVDGRCYRHECRYEPVRSLTIYISGGVTTSLNDRIITCSESEKGIIKNPGGVWIGGISCPDLNTICLGQKEIFNCPINCSGHGDIIDCKCHCNNGWSGLQCELYTCNNIAFSHSSVCSGNGNCTAINICECNNKYSGNNCENPICFNELNIYESCNYPNGSCISYNECECSSGYIGNTCEFDVTNLIINEDQWEEFEGAIASNKCGTHNGNDVAIYFYDNERREITSTLKERGNYSVNFYFTCGRNIQYCNSSNNYINNNVYIFLYEIKSNDFIDIKILKELQFNEYEIWTNINILYTSYYEHVIFISQPSFISYTDQWSISSLNMIRSNIFIDPFDTEHPSFIPKQWWDELFDYVIENWIIMSIIIICFVIIILIVFIIVIFISACYIYCKIKSKNRKVLPYSKSFIRRSEKRASYDGNRRRKQRIRGNQRRRRGGNVNRRTRGGNRGRRRRR